MSKNTFTHQKFQIIPFKYKIKSINFLLYAQNKYEQIMNNLSLFKDSTYYIIYIPLKSDNLLTIYSQFKISKIKNGISTEARRVSVEKCQ